MLRSIGTTAAALATLAVTALAFSGVAHAWPQKTIAGTEWLSGDVYLEALTVPAGATLQVTPHVAGDATTGVLRVHANSIHVEAGGLITATGAGCSAAGMASDPMCTSSGAGKLSATPGMPGGGGGYVGLGASGASQGPSCTAVPDAQGGAAFASTLMASAFLGPLPKGNPLGQILLGSPGGGANVTGFTDTAGAAGGGAIVLEAATIIVDGTVEARGNPSFEEGGVAPGAGSGGLVAFVVNQLTGVGIVTVAGGDGADGAGDVGVTPNVAANHGGGGGGGVIVVWSPSAPLTKLSLLVGGGATGTCMGANGAAGTSIVQTMGVGCIDADGDGFTSTACGGNDCDDSDPNIHPGATEVCNGLDDACTGHIDEGTDLCAPGSVCTAGACVASKHTGTTTPAPDAGPVPDYVTFDGGCGVAAGRVGAGGAVGLLGIAIAAMVARRRYRA